MTIGFFLFHILQVLGFTFGLLLQSEWFSNLNPKWRKKSSQNFTPAIDDNVCNPLFLSIQHSLFHCTENPCSQFLQSCIWEQFLYSHGRSYLESHSLPKLKRNWLLGLIVSIYDSVIFQIGKLGTLNSTSGGEGRAGNCRKPLFCGSSLHFSLFLRLSREFSHAIQQNRDLLDSHRPFICSVITTNRTLAIHKKVGESVWPCPFC